MKSTSSTTRCTASCFPIWLKIRTPSRARLSYCSFPSTLSVSPTMQPISRRWSCSWSKDAPSVTWTKRNMNDAAAAQTRPASRYRVLLVEDERDIRELVRYGLEQEGYIV